MNEAFGRRDHQPFDVRNRRYPIDYTLDPKNLSQKAAVKSYLLISTKPKPYESIVGISSSGEVFNPFALAS